MVANSPPLTVLYQDDSLVAIDKPSGWLVHRSNIDRHESRILVQALRDQIGRHVHPVHRLDKGTSGVMLFALDAASARCLAEQFERHEIHKTYWAVVRGWPPECGRIDHPLRDNSDDYADMPSTSEARSAITEFQRLATVELPHAVDRYPTSRYALVSLQPLTGRRHQLRRHMKHIAHPIIGDATHGKGRHNRFFAAQFGCDRLLLACTETRFRHPKNAAEMIVRTPVGDQFAQVMDGLGWSPPTAF